MVLGNLFMPPEMNPPYLNLPLPPPTKLLCLGLTWSSRSFLMYLSGFQTEEPALQAASPSLKAEMCPEA
jgi:hypothetical protein